MTDKVTAKQEYVGTICGPAKGTPAKPYRCICCRVAYDDIEKLGVSICWACQGGNVRCRSCRERGVPFDDFRVGEWRKYRDTMRFYPHGGKEHRVARCRGSLVVAVCGVSVPRKHTGQGVSVVPACPTCWPDGVGY